MVDRLALPVRASNLCLVMTLLRILHTESSKVLGGQEFRTLSEAIGMARRGHQVILAVQPDSRLKEYAEPYKLNIRPVAMTGTRWIHIVRAFLEIIRVYRIDLVNTHGSIDSWTASLAGRWAKEKPIIVRTRHKSTPILSTFRHRLLYNRLPHAVVTTAETVRTAMIQRNGIEPSRIVSIPSGVDLDRFYPSKPDTTLKETLGIADSHIVVGTVAFLRSYKGIHHLLHAVHLIAQAIPEVKCLIVGDGPEDIALRRLVKDLSLSNHVIFTGFRSDIPRLLSLVDVFVLPSTEGEGTPQALLQAMAMERPVVATAVGGIPEVVHDRVTGLIVPPNDIRSLTDAVTLICRDRALGERLGKAARQLILDSCSLETMLDRTEALYERLRKERSRANGRYARWN